MISTPLWFLLIGALLLFIALVTTSLKRLPVTSAIIYLIVGTLLGPSVLNVFRIDPLRQSALLEVLTEVAVLISLFSAGVKMPAPIHWKRWRTPVLLATLSMVASVAMVAAFAHYLLHLPPGACVLLGAILAPTDPVLATDVQIRHPGDDDQLRFMLTCEAGINDGSAFPFVMLGLGLLAGQDLGEAGLRWGLLHVAWAALAGIALGLAAGMTLALLIWKIRGEEQSRELKDDFLGLGLIGVVYGLSVLINAGGFLAVFFAAVALHQTELALASIARHPPHPAPLPRASWPPAVTPPEAAGAASEPPAIVSEGSLVFKEHLERLAEVLLILLVGGMLFVGAWSWQAVGVALFLFAVVRPASVLLGMVGSGTSWRMRGLIGWFGVRGIGSLYYLMYSLRHGLPDTLALPFVQLTLVVITLSVIFHGATTQPLLRLFWRRQRPR